MNTICELHSSAVEGLLLISLDLDLTVDVKVFEDLHEVAVREIRVFWDVVYEAE